ncbi:alpha/beta fold hydrolase [Leifsonia sp. NPDC058230]|uniref:alpha/beta fold hydrolase n=1 Tax=Leifsonia sp. NPDC058230 TaxID=3346391 RepID=UPI0036D99E3C
MAESTMGGMANLTFTLESGRTVGVTTFGDSAAERLVVFCHSAPGSSMFDPEPTVSSTRNVHIVALDRPGYGSSEPLPPGTWPSITRYADDIAEYLRVVTKEEIELGITRPRTVGIAGWSAGGRVALAFAARYPDLVDRVALIATPAPNEKVRWIDPPLQAESDRLATLPPDAAIAQLTAMVQPQALAVLAAEDDDAVPLDLIGDTQVDADVLRLPGARDRLARMLRDAYRQGAHGVAADILSYTAHPWGFALGDVAAKTLIVSGRGDPIAGSAHAAWYQKALPDARVEMFPGAGHLVVIPAWERVLSHLAPGTLRQ